MLVENGKIQLHGAECVLISVGPDGTAEAQLLNLDLPIDRELASSYDIATQRMFHGDCTGGRSPQHDTERFFWEIVASIRASHRWMQR